MEQKFIIRSNRGVHCTGVSVVLLRKLMFGTFETIAKVSAVEGCPLGGVSLYINLSVMAHYLICMLVSINCHAY